MALFDVDETHPTLNKHALKGKLKGRYSINISGDLRAIYKIVQSDGIIFYDFSRLGTHSELY